MEWVGKGASDGGSVGVDFSDCAFYPTYTHEAVIKAVDKDKAKKGVAKRQTPAENDDNPPPGGSAGEPAPTAEEATHQGKLILDATVAPQAIRFPTDLSLLNEAREFSEQIVDRLYAKAGLKHKPRTYRHKARKAYLAIVKKKRPGAKLIRRGIKQQLQYLRRNLGHIEQLLTHFPAYRPLPLPRWLLHRYWVIHMCLLNSGRCTTARPDVAMIAS